jgi:glycosyltransferase involved in cell wall biosynthesis
MFVHMVVSILLATFNGISFLKDQIDSILAQDYENWLLFISDDGSVDDTITLIKKYRDKYKEKIFLIKNTHYFGNARDNFFNLLMRTPGDLFFFCDQDDYWEKNKLSKLISAYDTLPESEKKKPILIHSDLMVVDANMDMMAKSFFKFSNINPEKNRLRNVVVQNIVTGCTMMINKPLKDRIASNLKKNENLYEHIIMHDWYCALVAAAFGKIICVNQPLVKYRQHGKNSVGAKNVWSIKYLLGRLKNYSKVKINLINTQRQVYVFSRMYADELSFADKKLLITYASINNFIKFYRIFFVIRYGFLKHGLFRIIEQIIFI